jgi:hypothetical protein
MKLAISSAVTAALLAACLPARAADHTRWRFEPSMKFDALCLAGVLADDPFYVPLYPKQYDELSARLTPEAREAFKRITERTKADGGIATAWLALVFSASDAETLPQMIQAAEHPARMKAALQKSRFWDDGGWARFEALQPDIVTALKWYRDIDFLAYWRADAEAPVKAAIAELTPQLDRADPVPLIEQVLGRKLDSGEIRIAGTRYCRPHGIRVTGDRFLTDPTYPKAIVLSIVGGTSVHEMLHPPYDPKDPRVINAMAVIAEDPFVQSRFNGHNPDFGYNSWAGYFDEDSTQALDQTINERIGFSFDGGDPARRWTMSDDGMHVLAAALHTLMVKEKFLDSGQDYTSFLDRMVKEGRLAPGKIEALVPEPVRKMKPKGS